MYKVTSVVHTESFARLSFDFTAAGLRLDRE